MEVDGCPTLKTLNLGLGKLASDGKCPRCAPSRGKSGMRARLGWITVREKREKGKRENAEDQ